jgi:putative transposase
LHRLLARRGIHCGRDRLFSILRSAGLLIRPRKRYIQTTDSRHWMRKYPNLLAREQIQPTRPEQVWVSDITYVKTDEGYSYLALVTDAYSRKIVGYNLADSLEGENARKAFQMALRDRRVKAAGLIHHSDRGYQYCAREYVRLAEDHQVRLSMTENGDPYENALAERMNRTLKEEFCLENGLPSRDLAAQAVAEAIRLYNTYRPHNALAGQTPEAVHEQKSR